MENMKLRIIDILFFFIAKTILKGAKMYRLIFIHPLVYCC